RDCAVRAGCILRDQTDNGSFATASPGTPSGAVRQAILWRLSAHEAVRRPPCVTGTSVREPASCESAGGADLRRASADSRPQLGGPFRRSGPCNPSALPASQLRCRSWDRSRPIKSARWTVRVASASRCTRQTKEGSYVQTATTQYDRD